MTNQWNVTVGGRERRISVERAAETGKDVIRVDGRTAARPLTPQEQERVFEIDGFQYALRRSDEGFTIDQLVQADNPPDVRYPLPAQAQAEALGVPTDSGMGQLLRFWWVGLVAAVAILMYMLVPNYEDDAAKRVKYMLDDLKGGSGSESQIATGLWARNTRNMGAGELAGANNQFTNWRREKEFFYEKGFTNYKVIESKEIEGAEVPTAVVTFEVEGTQYKVVVPERRPMTWAE